MVVQHNLTAMNSNRMLGLTTKSQAKSTEKLSSGYKINRAADDAAGLAISEKMRRQVRGLTQASLNAQDGISAVQTAEGALTEVHDMLQRMNELATKSANGTNSQEERDYIQSEIDALIAEVDRVSETTKFNEIYLLKGAQDSNGTPAETPAVKKTVSMKESTIQAMEGKLAIKNGVTATIYGAVTGEEVTSDAAAAAASMKLDATKIAALTAGDKFYASTDGTNNSWVEVTDANLATYFDVDDAGTVTAKAGMQFKTGTDVLVQNGGGTAATGTDYVTGTAKTDASTSNIDKYVRVDENGDLKYKDGMMLYTADIDTTGQHGAQITNVAIKEEDLGNYFESKGTYIYTDAAGTTKLAKDDDMSDYFDEFGVYKNNLYMAQDDGTIVEIGAEQVGKYFNFENAEGEDGAAAAGPALEFKLQVGAEGNDDNTITVKIESMSAAGIGVDGLKETGVKTQDAAQAAIETIKGAIKKVSQQRSDLGAVQNRLEHTINNLDNVVENTTAAESQIRDTDMATEMVRYSNNQILAQAGQAMLAQANQSNQGVLSLLG